MMPGSQKIKKIIASLLVAAVLAPSFLALTTPKKAEAQVVTVDPVQSKLGIIGNAFQFLNTTADVTSASLGVWGKAREILRMTLQIVAKRLLAEMTKSTVNWINSGFYGKPLFLENPDSFFKDVTQTQLKAMINFTGLDPQRYPFAKGYWLRTINRYKQTLTYNMESSLSQVTTDPAGYRRNFRIGGFQGLLDIVEDPNENALGFNITADSTVAEGIFREVNKITTALDQGQGFLSPQICLTNGNARNPYNQQDFDPDSIPYNPPYENWEIKQAWDDEESGGFPDPSFSTMSQAKDAYDRQRGTQVDQARAANDAANACPGGWKNTTPGYVAASQIVDALGTPRKDAEMSRAFGMSLASVFDALLNQFLNKGLTQLSNRINPGPQQDNWSYFGVRLDDSTTTPSGWAGLPDEVVDLDKFNKEVAGRSVITDSSGVVIAETIGNCDGRTVTVIDFATGSSSSTVNCAPSAPYDSNNPGIRGTATVTYPPPQNTTSSGTYVYIPGAIVNTALELRIVDETQPSNLNPQVQAILDKIRPVSNNQNPGLLQITDKIWPEAYSLDQCIPGPNKDWEKRLDEERDRIINTKLTTEMSNEDTWKAKAATAAVQDLRFAVQSFKDWIMIRMTTLTTTPGGLGLPNSMLYVDAVQATEDNAQEIKEATDKRRGKLVAVARLQSIESLLAPFTVKPVPGSPEEKRLVEVRKQFNSVAADIANEISIENLQAELDLATEELEELISYNASCSQERQAAGWNGRGGPQDRLTGFPVVPYKDGEEAERDLDRLRAAGVRDSKRRDYFYDRPPTSYATGQEIEAFCLVPINSGYSHGEIIRTDESNEGGGASFTFRNHLYRNGGNHKATAGYEELPMVNAFEFYGDRTGRYPVTVDINCNTVFNTSLNSYKYAGDEGF